MAIVIALIVMFIQGVKPILDTLTKLLDSLNEINKDTEAINKDIEAITYTMNNSVPLFVDIAFYLSITRSVLHDYFKTKKSKRSILKSAVNEYQNVSRKYNKSLDPETIKNILLLVKQFA